MKRHVIGNPKIGSLITYGTGHLWRISNVNGGDSNVGIVVSNGYDYYNVLWCVNESYPNLKWKITKYNTYKHPSDATMEYLF